MDNHQVEGDVENVEMNFVEHEDDEDVMELEEVNNDDKAIDEENERCSDDSDDQADDEDNPNHEDPPHPQVAQNDDHHQNDENGYSEDEDDPEIKALDLLYGDLSEEELNEPITSKLFLQIYRAVLVSILRMKSKLECAVSVNCSRHSASTDLSVENLMKEYEAEEKSDATVTPKMLIHFYGFYLKLIAQMESYVVSEEVARADLKAMDQIAQEVQGSEEGEGMNEQLTCRMYARVVKLIIDALGRVNQGMKNLEKAQNNKARKLTLDRTAITYNWPLDGIKVFKVQEENLKKMKEKGVIQASSPSNHSSRNEYETLIEYITCQDKYIDPSVEGMIKKLLNRMFEVNLQQKFVFLDMSLKKKQDVQRFEGTQTYCLLMDCISSKHGGGCTDINFIRGNIQKWFAHKKDRLRTFNHDDDDSDY